MRTHQACIPCITSLIESTLDKTDLSGPSRLELLNNAMMELSSTDRNLPPACISGELFIQIMNASGQDDIFQGYKQTSIQEALKLYPRLKKMLNDADDQLEAAIRISALGNILDIANPKGYDLDEELEKLFQNPIEGDSLKTFQLAIENASSLLILGDNAGEAVFDRVLIEYLDLPVVYAVKSAPAFDDALITDAADAGIAEVADLIATGTIFPGTYLPSCSPEFKELFYSVPLILAKGQANYETLSDIDRELYFLLKTKCEVVASEINFPLGSLVLKRHRN